ncbi:MAG: hypothetical protein Q7J28_03160 [Caulobacter sp.]|nr:hypothetical protein [Caulobacter sp.]
MNSTIDRLKIIFIGIFLVSGVALWAFQILYVMPAKKCEAGGQWWDRGRRVCAQPIYIPDMTGRPEGVSRKEWSERKAAEEVQRDHLGYPQATAPAAPAASAPATPPALPQAPPPLPAAK